MTVAHGFWEILALVGAVHGLFLAIVLGTEPRGNRTANRILAALVALYSVHLLHIALYWIGGLTAVVHFWGAAWFLPYLYGPLLYLYVRSSSAPRPLGRRDLLHGLPFAAALLLFSRFYLLDAETKRRMLEVSYDPSSGAPGPLVLIFWSLQLAHFSAYVASASKRSRWPLSSAEIRWTRRLVGAFAASFACWFAYGLAVSLGVSYSRSIDVAATMAMTVAIYAVGYTGLREPEIFLGELSRRRARGVYENAPLGPADLAELREKLVRVMRQARPHRDPNLKLFDLARLLEVTPHELSQLLNQGLGERFNDFVNRYRVEEAKRLLQDPDHRGDSLLSLAFEAGFNNKTSFNNAFKKHVRMTPSRYRAEIVGPTARERPLL